MTISGHDYFVEPYGMRASRIEYDRLISEWLANGLHPPKPGTTDLSIAELSLAFLRYAKTYYVKDGQPTSTLNANQTRSGSWLIPSDDVCRVVQEHAPERNCQAGLAYLAAFEAVEEGEEE